MVPSQMKIDPGRRSVQLPHAGRNTAHRQFSLPVDAGQPPVGPEPHAGPLGVYLAESVQAAAAGAVSNMLGSLGFRAQKTDMLNAAVSTHPARKQHFFEPVFHEFDHGIAPPVLIQPLAKGFVWSGKFGVKPEEQIVHRIQRLEMEFVQTACSLDLRHQFVI